MALLPSCVLHGDAHYFFYFRQQASYRISPFNVFLPANETSLHAWPPALRGSLESRNGIIFVSCTFKEERIMSNSDLDKVELHKDQTGSQPRESQETLDSIMDG